MAIYFILLLSLLNFSAFAQGLGQPSQDPICKSDGVSFKNHDVILNSDGKLTSRIFLIQNKAGGIVIVNKHQINPSASAGWSSKIQQGKASALSMSEPNFPLACMYYNPPALRLVDCQSVLDICTITPKNPQGSFWIAENTSLIDIFKTLKQRNIIN